MESTPKQIVATLTWGRNWCSVKRNGKGTAMKGWETNAMLYNQQKKQAVVLNAVLKTLKLKNMFAELGRAYRFFVKNVEVQIILTGLLTNSL